MRNNIVGHVHEGVHDKVYIACVRLRNGFWDMVGKYGKRNKGMKEQVKSTHKSIAAARHAMYSWYEQKARASCYVNIESPTYSGELTLHDTWLSSYLEAEQDVRGFDLPVPKAPKDFKPKLNLPNPADVGFAVECIDAFGFGDRFVEGCLYPAEPHVDSEMLWVVDGNGKRDEYFAERFTKATIGSVS